MLSICCNHFVNVSISFGEDVPHLHGKKHEVISVLSNNRSQISKFSGTQNLWANQRSKSPNLLKYVILKLKSCQRWIHLKTMKMEETVRWRQRIWMLMQSLKLWRYLQSHNLPIDFQTAQDVLSIFDGCRIYIYSASAFGSLRLFILPSIQCFQIYISCILRVN